MKQIKNIRMHTKKLDNANDSAQFIIISPVKFATTKDAT